MKYLIILCLLLGGCGYGRIKDDRAIFIGCGSLKIGDTEIRSEPPIKIGNFGGVK